jgi:hypothetical protein
MARLADGGTSREGLVAVTWSRDQLWEPLPSASAGVSASTVGAYECDVRQPTMGMLGRLLEAVGCEMRVHLEPYDPRLAHDSRAANGRHAARAPL